ncbi:hypothetical protein AAG747_25300 [Rapidithrix thailandica]|uniref:Uncharacterized protein n=1 Tax=Rapidithrix thailandica TaxID=413964 RepID=A0AAW9SE97_9BACT
MTKGMKIKLSYLIIIGLTVFLGVGGILNFYLNRIERRSQPATRKVEIRSSDGDFSIFIKLKSWGMTGDHQVIVISENPNDSFQVDNSTDYIYEGLIPFFYKQNGDTLKIYATKKSPVPENFKNGIVIKQIELNNAELMNLYDDYEEKGLKKISN